MIYSENTVLDPLTALERPVKLRGSAVEFHWLHGDSTSGTYHLGKLIYCLTESYGQKLSFILIKSKYDKIYFKII